MSRPLRWVLALAVPDTTKREWLFMTAAGGLASGILLWSVLRNLVRQNVASSLVNEEMGLTKLVCDAASGKLLGVQMLGPHAEDLIVAGAIALRGGLTLQELTEIHAVFPTTGSMCGANPARDTRETVSGTAHRSHTFPAGAFTFRICKVPSPCR